MTLADRIIARLDARGIAYDVVTHPPIRTVEEAEALVPGLVEALLKTIAFQVKDAGWVLAVVHARARVDYRRLAGVLGINRRQLRSLSPAAVERELGFEVGGVGPIHPDDAVQTILDKRLQGLGRIYCGSGRRTATLHLDFDDLVRVSDGRMHPISRSRDAH